MKRYAVVVTPEAEIGIVTAFQYIYERSSLNAQNWLRALYKKIDTLELMPSRCAVARENDYIDDHLRQLIFKSYRIVFSVDEDERIVHVLYVRHAKQQAIGELVEDEGNGY